jgi:hypothetical protein
MIRDIDNMCVIVRVSVLYMFMSVSSVCCSFLYCTYGGTPLGSLFRWRGPFLLRIVVALVGIVADVVVAVLVSFLKTC